MSVSVEVYLRNQYGDSRQVIGHGETQAEAITAGVEWANEHNPPTMWPVGVPHGTWAMVDWRPL